MVTGCSHPGVTKILKKSKNILNKDIEIVFGGFHLRGQSQQDITEIIDEFKKLNVKRVGATHCSGDMAIAAFKKVYGDHYIPMGVGRVLNFPLD